MQRALSFGVLALLMAWFCRDGVRVHAQTLLGPNQLRAPRVSVLQCSQTTATSSCVGLYYIDVITPAGTELKILGAPAASTIDPTIWSIVP